MNNTTFISIVILFCLSIYLGKKVIDQKTEIRDLKADKKEVETKLMNTSERALKYQLIALKLDSICDMFQSSRNAKQNDKELLKLCEL